MGTSLSSGQRDVLTVGTALAPVAGLAYLAAGSDGAFARAGRRGGVLSLVGACGLACVGFAAAKKESGQLGNTFWGCLIGGAGGLAAGIAGSFAYDSLRAASR